MGVDAYRRGYEFDRNEIKERKRQLSFTCEKCGTEGKTFAHHIVSIGYAVRHHLPHTIISSMANCKMLCESCHEEADRAQTNESLGALAQAMFGIAVA